MGFTFPEDPSPAIATAEKEMVADFIDDGIQRSRVHSLLQWDVQKRQYEDLLLVFGSDGYLFSNDPIGFTGKGENSPLPSLQKTLYYRIGSRSILFLPLLQRLQGPGTSAEKKGVGSAKTRREVSKT